MRINRAEHLKAFGEYNLSLQEWYVLAALGAGPKPSGLLPREAAGTSRGDPRGRVTEAMTQFAMERLLTRKLICCVDQEWLRSMQRRFVRVPRPINGLPVHGDVDLTRLGATTYLTIRKLLDPEFPRHEWYSRRRAAVHVLHAPYRQGLEEGVHHWCQWRGARVVGRPRVLERLRVFWWLSYRRGYRIAVRLRS
jgi:hypothetical protein